MRFLSILVVVSLGAALADKSKEDEEGFKQLQNYINTLPEEEQVSSRSVYLIWLAPPPYRLI